MRIENANLWVDCDEAGKSLTIHDRVRNQAWTLVEDGVVFSLDKEPDSGKYSYAQLSPVSAKQTDGGIAVTYEGACQGAHYSLETRYSLGEDYIEVTLPGDIPPEIQAVSLPGTLAPGSGEAKHLLPIMQGMYWDGRGGDFEWSVPEGSHGGFSLAMFGMIGETGGLLVAAETANDTLWRVGKKDGRPFAANIQRASLGRIGYERKVRVYPTQPSIAAVAKRYRKRIMERGRFVSWEEKLKIRPELERLFGTVFGFVGYCQDDIDYAEECEKLKKLGLPKAHLFPLRFNTFSEDFKMGGFPPIDQNKQTVAKIKELGYDVAPWSWICEALDDGSEETRLRYRLYHDGKTRVTWEIDDYKWHKTCNYSLPDYQKKAIEEGACEDLTWDHFDVMACACNLECYATDHSSHMGRPMDRTEDRELIRRLLLTAQAGGSRPISSEGFNDAYSMEYDIGSVLAWPQYGPWDFWPIPLTMLVFHDSMIHTWWEAHAYNDSHFGRDNEKYQYGGGKPKLMSAMDALYGNPPFIFPFGAQYAWTGNGTETFLYKYRLEDPVTRIATDLAREVARLHERIGKAEMTDFSFVTDDGYVQKTTFEGGVEVYANFGPRLRYIPGAGTVESESWKVILPE